MTRTRIKICGVTRSEDARLAVELGADAIGVVFASRSKRRIDAAQAAAVLDPVQGTTRRVGLFMDQDADFITAVLNSVELDLLQFHGREQETACATFGLPWLKAVSIAQTEVPDWEKQWPSARGFIVDSHAPGAAGGSGESFDWSRFPGDSQRPLILAGGLGPDNVADAIAAAAPWGVDVASGVEAAPGIKSPDRLTRFFEEVRKADERG